MKPETVEDQTIYLYNHLADNIEWGIRDADIDSESFTDPRGGFISPLMWVEKHVEAELSDKNLEAADALLLECRELLNTVSTDGWTSDQVEIAKSLITKLRNQKWYEA